MASADTSAGAALELPASRSISTGSVIPSLADGRGPFQGANPRLAGEFRIGLAVAASECSFDGHRELRTVPRLPAAFELHCRHFNNEKSQA